MTTSIWATVALPGFHRWPDAPENRAYLRDRHRHLFEITAAVLVAHDDRDVEFHDLGDLIRGWWAAASGDQPARECGPMSCEALARELLELLTELHDLRVAWVTVSEDGEAGATIVP